MVCGMDEAGLLNSMTDEQLRVTCNRLTRSCNDMEMLLNEFQDEQVMLRREQDRLHQRIEKVTSQIDTNKKDRGTGNILWNLINDVDMKLEVSAIFRQKEERKAAKRRKGWSRHVENAPALKEAKYKYDEEDSGPFSDLNVQKSWGCDMTLGALRQPASKGDISVDFNRWVRETVCGDPVAEAELPPELQFAVVSPVVIPRCPSPTSRGSEVPGDANLTFGTNEPAARRGMWSPRGDRTPPGQSPASARRVLEPTNSTFRPDPMASPKTRFVGPDGLEINEEVDAAPAPQSFSRRMSEAAGVGGAIFGMFASWTEAAEPPSLSRNGDAEAPGVLTSLTVVLRRSSEDKWGLHWIKDGFTQKQERVVDKLVEGSVADVWNKQQEQSDHPERRIQPLDRLASVNGKTGRDEMKNELTGQEVVLEFHRVIPHREWLAAQPKGAGEPPFSPDAASAQSSGPSPRRDRSKATFQDAFSAYLEANAPGFSPEQTKQETQNEDGPNTVFAGEELTTRENDGAGTPIKTEVSFLPEESEPAKGPLDPCYSAAKLEIDGEVEAIARPPNDTPYGFVVQVLSRSSGSLRLSWLFDWEAAPSELQDQEWAARSYEVLRRSKAGESEEDEEIRIPSQRPQLALELPVGRCYTFLVVAVLTDTRVVGDASDDAVPSTIGPVWTSRSSATVWADLRGTTTTTALPQERESPARDAGGSEPSKVATPVVRSRGAVASRLGSFLEQRPVPGVSSPSHGALASSASPKQKTSSPSSPSGLDETSVLSEIEPRSAAVVMGPFVDPITTSMPRFVGNKGFDPAAEKRDITERLRKRRKRNSKTPETELGIDRQRSLSMDSDEEGSLMRLSNALSSLEKTASVKLKEFGGEAVAQEGHHSLHMRLDSPHQEPVNAATGARSSAAAAAAGAALAGVSMARGQWHELPMPMATLAQDFSDDPGWANLTEPDVVQDSVTTNATNDAALATSAFRLRVQLADDRVSHIEFADANDLPQRIKEFVAANGVREIFETPLLERAEMMARAGKSEDSVDIVDLLE